MAGSQVHDGGVPAPRHSIPGMLEDPSLNQAILKRHFGGKKRPSLFLLHAGESHASFIC